jgi:hypothetical protein
MADMRVQPRWLLATSALVVAGCADSVKLDIAVNATATGLAAYVGDSSCDCRVTPAWPDEGACDLATDIGKECTCHPGACLTSVRVENNGVVVTQMQLAEGEEHELLNLSGAINPGSQLVFEGCGDPIRASLPNEFPADVGPPTSVVPADDTHVRVTWASNPDDAYLVTASSMFQVARCRTVTGASSFDVPVTQTQGVLVGLYPLVEVQGVATESATIRVWASTGQHQF